MRDKYGRSINKHGNLLPRRTVDERATTRRELYRTLTDAEYDRIVLRKKKKEK